jgi:uncharacterized protein YjbI with pentapeptide repeats
MTQGGNIYRAAERRLLDAIRAGVVCDFADDAKITAAEMASWGPERTIRATLLRRLITAKGARYAKFGVHLRGAAVEGVLDLAGLNVMPLVLERCRIDTVQTAQATFVHARFDGTTFTGDMSFEGATSPSSRPRLVIMADSTGFGGATFTGKASFIGATFAGPASFGGAIFAGDTSFNGATFEGNAWFVRATFARKTEFNGATFAREAEFVGAIFTDVANFGRATFTGDAGFGWATFTSFAGFAGATFTSLAQFNFAIAECYDFRGAQFHKTDPGPWVARRVNLTEAVFHVQARVAIAAITISCRRLQAREGVHLVVRGGDVDLEDAQFLRHSILAHSGSEPSVPEQRPAMLDEQPTPGYAAKRKASDLTAELAQQLSDELAPQPAYQTQILSLRRATAGDLVLSGVGLEHCTFARAHGLDKLRIEATCYFQRQPLWLRRTWRPFTSRRVIFEEVQWRRIHTRGWPRVAPILDRHETFGMPASRLAGLEQMLTASFADATSTPRLDRTVPTALEIAGIYRDLRKALEDAKDEPGAADFYYGEMEMRRLAARPVLSRPTLIGLWKAIWHPIVWVRQRWNNHRLARGLGQSWIERRLLDAYWAVSGYGLRAWRALTALAVLLVGSAALFTRPEFVELPPDHFATSLEFSARESLTLIRASGDPLLKTIGIGTVLDIALRLLAPLLLGLAVLAVRGRTKR